MKKILIVDDSNMNLIILKGLLLRLGESDVTFASNGAIALDILKNDPSFDYVLTDVWMPEMNGMQLAESVRNEPALQHIKLYATTTDEEFVFSCEKYGFCDVLLKPIRFGELGRLFASFDSNILPLRALSPTGTCE